MHSSNILMDGYIAVFSVAEKGAFEAAGKYLSISKSAIHERVLNIDDKLATAVFRPYRKKSVSDRWWRNPSSRCS